MGYCQCCTDQGGNEYVCTQCEYLGRLGTERSTYTVTLQRDPEEVRLTLALMVWRYKLRLRFGLDAEAMAYLQDKHTMYASTGLESFRSTYYKEPVW